jgi:voltage-gated potassium channel Kch
MLLNIAIAAVMLVVTTAIHATAMMLALHRITPEGAYSPRRFVRVYRISSIVILMSLAALLEVLIYALTYLALNAIEGLEKALYFSMVTYTTLGYGEIVLDEQWRLLASFEAANGIIMFGWTTAIVIAVVQRV